MAATAFSLHLRSSSATRRTPTFLHRHFSSSPSTSSPQNPNPNPENPNPSTDSPQSQSSFSSYFSDVKSSLTNTSPPPPPPPPRQQFQNRFSAPRTPPSRQQPASIDQIRRDLSEFRLRTAPPESALNPSPPPRPVSFQELYQRSVTNKEGDSSNPINKGQSISLGAISESLRQLRAKSSKTNQEPIGSLKSLKENFMLRSTDPRNPPLVMGSPRKLQETFYSKELKEKNDGNTSPAMKTEFVKMYSYKELGEKLRGLRPEGKPEDGFSLQELNDRLIKLREMEEREPAAKIGKGPFIELRHSLVKIRNKEDEQKQRQMQFLKDYGQTPAFMGEPQEHLVEKYFHPDNMSSAEKLKIELQKVRDEFKMSESDCGSARVQVAQLTTKIKHLTTALHKKDTHSRKGLQGMIQQRKKLLKYLRRTDWDSYTLVLSKFGLRDNPDHKRLPTKEKKKRKA